MAVSTSSSLDSAALRADFPFLEEQVGRQAARVSRFGFVDAEATPGARPDALVLRARVRERPSRRLPAGGARHGGLRRRPSHGRCLRQRTLRARGDLHPQRHRGDQPRRVRMGAAEPRPRRHRRDHRARAPRELRPLAVHRQQDRRELPPHPDRRRRRASARRARRACARGLDQGRRDRPRLQLARHDQPGRASRGLGARAGRDHGRRRGAGGAAPDDRRAGARLRLPRLLVPQAVRPERRRRALGPRASFWRRWSRSISAAR